MPWCKLLQFPLCYSFYDSSKTWIQLILYELDKIHNFCILFLIAENSFIASYLLKHEAIYVFQWKVFVGNQWANHLMNICTHPKKFHYVYLHKWNPFLNRWTSLISCIQRIWNYTSKYDLFFPELLDDIRYRCT